MKLHPRTMLVQKASAEISVAVAEIASKHGLTFLELIGILAEQILVSKKYALRRERHPDDPDEPADAE